MANLIEYNPEADSRAFAERVIQIHGQLFDIDTGTTAGRTQPDGPSKPNEDAFSVTGYRDGMSLAIFDGASSQKPIPELDGVSGARFASHTLKELFEDLPYGETARTALQGLNYTLGKILNTFASVDMTDMNSLPTSTASIARIAYPEARLYTAHVGDSFITAQFKDGSTQLLTNNLHRKYDVEVLGLIEKIAQENGITPREAREDPQVHAAIADMFQTTRNRPDGTGEGIVNGDPNMDKYIDMTAVSLKGVRAFILGSDGLVSPDMDICRSADRQKLFDTAHSGGVQGLIDLTRSVEDADPDRRLVRYKHSDDATGIYVELH